MRNYRHPDDDIEAAIRHAEKHGWTCLKARGHAWGLLRCPWNDRECRCGEFCQQSIWSTPRNPANHARQLRRIVDRCAHIMGPEEEDR